MAYLGKEIDSDGEEIEIPEVELKPGDKLINTKGASLNYVLWELPVIIGGGGGAFCADKNTLRGVDAEEVIVEVLDDADAEPEQTAQLHDTSG